MRALPYAMDEPIYWYVDRQTDVHTYKKATGLKDKKADTQTQWQTYRQIDRQSDKQAEQQADQQADKRTDRLTHAQTDWQNAYFTFHSHK